MIVQVSPVLKNIKTQHSLRGISYWIVLLYFRVTQGNSTFLEAAFSVRNTIVL